MVCVTDTYMCADTHILMCLIICFFLFYSYVFMCVCITQSPFLYIYTSTQTHTCIYIHVHIIYIYACMYVFTESHVQLENEKICLLNQKHLFLIIASERGLSTDTYVALMKQTSNSFRNKKTVIHISIIITEKEDMDQIYRV